MSDSTGVLVSTRDLFTDPEAVALGGFLAGYSGLTREAYALDLRQFAAWVTGHGFRLLDIRRAHLEAFARDLETHANVAAGSLESSAGVPPTPRQPLGTRHFAPVPPLASQFPITRPVACQGSTCPRLGFG